MHPNRTFTNSSLLKDLDTLLQKNTIYVKNKLSVLYVRFCSSVSKTKAQKPSHAVPNEKRV